MRMGKLRKKWYKKSDHLKMSSRDLDQFERQDSRNFINFKKFTLDVAKYQAKTKELKCVTDDPV